MAGMALSFTGWWSALSRLLAPEQVLRYLDGLAELRLGPARSVAEEFPRPIVTSVRRHNRDALDALAEHRDKIGKVFLQALEDLQKSAPAYGSVGRNEPCPCGSGRKFKKCCSETWEEGRRRRNRAQRCLELGEEPVGFLVSPSDDPDWPRMLALLAESNLARLDATPGDRMPVRWAAAYSRFIRQPTPSALGACLEMLEQAPHPELDAESVLVWLAVLLNDHPSEAARLIPAAARLSSGPALSILAAVLTRGKGDELTQLLHEVLARGRGAHEILSVLEAAMEMDLGPEMAEESIPFLREAAAMDPRAQEALEAVLEWSSWEESLQLASRQEIPSEITGIASALKAVERAPDDVLLQSPQGGLLLSLTARIRAFLTWPAVLDEVSEDSQDPLDEERSTRRRLAAEAAWLFENAVRVQSDELSKLIDERRDALFLILAGEELAWCPPEGEAETVASAAGVLAAELGLGLPRALNLGSRLALCQSSLPGHEPDIQLCARVALEECCAVTERNPWEPVLVVQVGGLPEAHPAPPPEADPHLLEKARRTGRHPLELAAYRAAMGRPLASSRTVVSRSPRLAPEGSLPPQPPHEPTRTADPDCLPISLVDDPVPARKALRRVLRRLFRLGKIGEAHTAVDLVSRGVADHLRGPVKDCVNFLLAQGILRDKPTLVGQHTSIEPRHLPAVQRFVQEGWLPHPRLAQLLGLA
ncbi:MAG: SEC-C domain-containing protein [Armatimonadetes bacterium]|nr:SEC-C domain-containing protein [Armatimonadota bacterium]